MGIGTPGGALASRPLHFIWMVDCSGSMSTDGKIQALNAAVREAIPAMRDAAGQNPNAQVLMRVLAFSTGARWIVPQPTPLDSFTWTDLVADGTTDMGAALTMVADVLTVPPMESRALPPVLVLVSDGHPTDDLESGLTQLLGQPWGQKAVRMAIAIGRDADQETLRKFIANSEIKPLQAGNPEQLTRYIRWVSTVIAAVSKPAADGDGGPDGAVSIPALDTLPPDADSIW